jgi:hypothetical protein
MGKGVGMRGKNGRLPFSTGSWLKVVLKITILHQFVAQICAKDHHPLAPIRGSMGKGDL